MVIRNGGPTPEDVPELSGIAKALDEGAVMVVGAGIAGCQVVNDLQVAAESTGRPLRIHWVAAHWNSQMASRGAGGWAFPFLCDDPRIPRWTQESFMNWPMLERLGLHDYLVEVDSLIVTREDHVHLPPGHPGTPMPVQPADYGLPYYPHGVTLTSTVLSTCAVMPDLHQRLARKGSVTMATTKFHDIADMTSYAQERGLQTVVVAVGAGAEQLLGDPRIEGDLGVLLSIPTSAVPLNLRGMVIMDEDAPHELTYLIEHQQCGHTVLGGTSGELFSDDELTFEPEVRWQLAQQIKRRHVERMPLLRDALAEDNFKIWWGYRPAGSEVIMEWLPRDITAGLSILHLGGLGGSGFTITPAFIQEALRLPEGVEDGPDGGGGLSVSRSPGR